MDEVQYRVARTLKVLGNPIRYQVFRVLAGHDGLSSAELAELLERDQANIGYHIGKLKGKDLIASHTEEQRPVYTIKREDVLEMLEGLEELFRR